MYVHTVLKIRKHNYCTGKVSLMDNISMNVRMVVIPLSEPSRQDELGDVYVCSSLFVSLFSSSQFSPF